MLNEFNTALVDAVDVTVDVHAIAIGPVVRLVDIEFIEAFTNFDFVDVFGDVNHLSSVLHKTAILAFWGFVGAQSSPLRRVEIPGFEVGLAANKR